MKCSHRGLGVCLKAQGGPQVFWSTLLLTCMGCVKMHTVHVSLKLRFAGTPGLPMGLRNSF